MASGHWPLAALLFAVSSAAAATPEQLGAGAGLSVAEALRRDLPFGATATVTVGAFALEPGDRRADVLWREAAFGLENALLSSPGISLRAANGAYTLTGDVVRAGDSLSARYRLVSESDQRVVSLGAFLLPFEGVVDPGSAPVRPSTADLSPAPGRRWTLWGGGGAAIPHDPAPEVHVALRGRDVPWEAAVRATTFKLHAAAHTPTVAGPLTQSFDLTDYRYTFVLSRRFSRSVTWLPGPESTRVPVSFQVGGGLCLDSFTFREKLTYAYGQGINRLPPTPGTRYSPVVEAGVALRPWKGLELFAAVDYAHIGQDKAGGGLKLPRLWGRFGASVRFL